MDNLIKKTLGILLVAFMLLITVVLSPAEASVTAGTTSLTIKKLANDGTTVLSQKTVTYQELMAGELNDDTVIPILGDGTTHYYHQGPVFVDDPDEATEQTLRWNQAEDTSVLTKDMGAVKGTNVKDLCDLVGGMVTGDTLQIKASDGLKKTFAYENVYGYSVREGPMAICWYKDGGTPETTYTEGMRLVWFADDSVNTLGEGGAGVHAFGNWDWHEAAAEQYWYFYTDTTVTGTGTETEYYPTTTGLSVQKVSELIILSDEEPPAPTAAFTSDVQSGAAPLTVSFTDQSTYNPTSWAWDFNNDSTVDSTEQNPEFTYETAGTYTVKMTATNAKGNDEEIKTDYITVSPAHADFPIQLIGTSTVDMSKADMEGLLNTANTYTDSNGNIFAGVPLQQLIAKVDDNDTATLNTSLLGTYNIVFTGLNQDGTDFVKTAAAGSWSTMITDGNIQTNDVFVATKVKIGGTGEFADLPLVSVNNATKNWRPGILNGSGITGSGNRIGGLYKIELTGLAAVAPTAAFTSDVQSGAAPLTVSFTDQSTGTPTSWAWDFNNDSTVDSTEQNPEFTYETAGTYTVKLTATNTEGNDEEIKNDYITVTEASTMDVLYDGTVALTLNKTFDVTAYNSSASYTVDETTPLGALQATGLTYGVTDKNYASSGALLLDNVGTYLRDKTNSTYWYAYVNNVYKDGYNNAPDALNLMELSHGDKVEFYYAAGITDPTDLTAVKAAAVAAVKTVASTMDVLYDGTVDLTPDATFDVTAYNSSASYTVEETTPLGALQATGLTYGVTDKNYASSGALLLDNVGTYLRDKTNSTYWYAYVNDVYKDGYNNAPDALNLMELSHGDKVEFYYAAGITDPTDLTAVKAAAVAAVKTVASTGVAPTDWTLQLSGAKNVSVSKANFEAGLACASSGHQVFWTDTKDTDDTSDDDVWGGVPLWLLVAMVDDDPDVGSEHYNFNDDLAAENYEIKVIAGDGWSTILDSAAIARSDGYIIANTLNGEPLPLKTESDKDCWPLQLKGSAISGGQQVGNIARIELSGMPEPSVGWTLEVVGEIGDTITQAEFEEGLACTGSGHYKEWTDIDGNVWSGVPLWLLLGAVDNIETSSHWTFDNTLPASYTVKVVNAEGDYEKTFNGSDVAGSDDYIVADQMNGEPLTDSYPLRLVGDGVTKDDGSLGGLAVGNLARIEIPELQTPEAEAGSWNLTLSGKISDVIAQAEFEAALACPGSGHSAEWTDLDGNVWSGMPLWFLTGWVDDRQPHDYDANQAAAGYKVLVKASDGYSVDFDSSDVKWSNEYIVANKFNGDPLTDSWPLRLVGTGVIGDDGALSGISVGKITEIELTTFGTAADIPELHIVKYAEDGTSVLNEITIDYRDMESNYDVIGDGTTIYRYEGITNNPEDVWDAAETYPGGYKIANAVKGTRIKDLCDQVGGMGAGTEIVLSADDGYETRLPYSSIYTDPSVQERQGDAILAWWGDGDYVPYYADGMRLLFTPGGDHVYGQWDMHETLPSSYWHYYYSDNVQYPSCGGLSSKYITNIEIYSVPAGDWTLELDGTDIGGLEYDVSKTYFESALACQFGANHKATYTDTDSHLWEGMPLWFLAGFVDDVDQHSDESFNDELAESGYNVVITSTDGDSVTINSNDIIRNSGYIVANSLDGAIFPDADSNWPLCLVGSAVSGNNAIAQIKSIELVKPEATLQDLTISQGTLTPAFDPDTYSYTADVASTISSVTISATENDGMTASGDIGTFNLTKGANTFEIDVDGGATHTDATYTIIITRKSTAANGGGGGGVVVTPTVTGVDVKNAPDKVIYDEGDALDLTGLAVTLTYSNGTTKDVVWADFADYDITVAPEDGALLKAADSEIVIAVNGKTVRQTITVKTEIPVTPETPVNPPAEETPVLTDIDGHWAAEYIKYLVDIGAVAGYPDNTFKPDELVTRAEFAKMLVEAFGLTAESGKIFDDTADYWAKDYIAAAAAHGIVAGYNDNEFGPDDVITREQIAIMIVKAAGLDAVEGELTFADEADISSWAHDWVVTAAQNKLMSGYTDNTFRPQDIATRAEAVTTIVNALKLFKE